MRFTSLFANYWFVFLGLLFLSFASCGDDEMDTPMPSFELRPPLVITPTQISPTAFRVEWNAVDGADNYEIDVALDAAFSDILAPYNGVRETSTGLNVISLDNDTQHFIRVRTIIDGDISTNSNVVSATTLMGDPGPGDEPGTALKVAVDGDFSVGTAVSTPKLSGNYEQILAREYTQITAEYEMKMDKMYPSEGSYNFTQVDQIVNFAADRGIEVHGHALIWHNSTPGWVRDFAGTDEEFATMIEDYIKTVVGRYKDKVRSWDVVNEAFEDGGASPLRNSVFRQRLGDDFIEKCYRWTREADPDVLIFYNDYNMVIDDTKRRAALTEIDRIIAAGVQVDGFGFQMHIGHNGPSKNEIARTAKEVTDRGLLLHFSELDVAVNQDRTQDAALSRDRALAQKQKVKEVVEVYAAIPAASKFALTIWGIKDNDSWLTDFWNRPEYPLLYDRNFDFKPAHTGFLEGL